MNSLDILATHYRLDDASRRSDVNRLLHLVLEANTAIWLNKSVGRVVGGLSIGQLLRGRFLDEYSRGSNSGDLTRKQIVGSRDSKSVGSSPVQTDWYEFGYRSETDTRTRSRIQRV